MMANVTIDFNLSDERTASLHAGFNGGKKNRIAGDLTALIGNTPLLEMKRLAQSENAQGNIIAKLEYRNPGGSSKDRAALSMITDAENKGFLSEGGLIVEPTSGNMGIALAWIAKVKGYRAVIVMPENMSEERKKIIRAFGAELVLTPASLGMQGAVDEAKKLYATTPGAFMPDQFNNPANAEAHRLTTGPEILKDTYGKVDCFIAGVGTGGTLTGVGAVLKAFNKDVRIVAVEPAESPLLSGGQAGTHGIQGIGANFVPSVLDRSLIDEVIDVKTEQAYEYSRKAAGVEGLSIGISSGAALCAACQVAYRPDMNGKNIVVLLPDSGERYLSGTLYS